MSKTCTECRKTRPLDQFSKDKRAKDGLRSRCKVCDRAYHNANRERLTERMRAYHQANRERLNPRGRAYYHANRERMLEANRYWRSSNPEKRRTAEAKRRARKGCAVPQRWRLSDCDSLACYWCGRGLLGANPEVDHVMPIALGGPADPSNEVMACSTCNRSKRARPPLVWIAELL